MTSAVPASRKHALADGLRDVAPILAGVVPFGMIAGAAAVAAGLTKPAAIGMSWILFAGASQLAAIDLLARGSAWFVVLLTVLVVNLRFVMYSAVLAPWFARLPLPAKGALAYLLTDQAFAVTVARQRSRPGDVRLPWYYAGAALGLWSTWQASTVGGILLGAVVPAGWQLDFSIPLMFLALLVPLVVDRGSLAAAVAAGGVAVAAHGLPGNLGLILAAATGIAIGLASEPRTDSAAVAAPEGSE